MQNALLSALSGLRINQQYLDVIGNNLANATTPGFKSSRVSFVELLGQTIRPAGGPTGNVGGRNAVQVGTGANIGSVDVRMVQGSLLSTGRNLDLGIQGEGFFVVSDGRQDYYTRVGNFNFDSEGWLVDQRTGFKVQDRNRSDIQIELGSVVPAAASTRVEFQGNLPSEVEGPLAEVLQTDSPFEDHQPAILTGNAGPFPTVNPGDTLRLQVDFGATVTVTMPTPAGAALTTAEVAAAINAAVPGVIASDQGGTLVLQTASTGASHSLFIDPTGTATAALFPPSAVGVAAIGTESTATSSTQLNDLSSNTQDYLPGDQVRFSGTRPDGTPVTGIFVYGTGAGQDGTTLGAVVAKINSVFNMPTGGATAVLEADGTIKLSADAPGEASLSLTIQDLSSNTGTTNWSSHFFETTVDGTPPDQETIVSTVYDPGGQAHTVTFVFERQPDGTWNVTPSVDASEGQVLSGTITGIAFDRNGLLSQIPSGQIQVQWNNVPGTQNLDVDFGQSGETDGLTHFGLSGSGRASADGYGAGVLSSVSIRSDGVIEGFYTNTQILELGQLGIALFDNPAGLQQVGSSLWQFSSNSGDPLITAAEDGSAGSITAGALEGSNVAIAEEFVRLIEAQRGFQANARIISTTDEVLAELVNII